MKLKDLFFVYQGPIHVSSITDGRIYNESTPYELPKTLYNCEVIHFDIYSGLLNVLVKSKSIKQVTVRDAIAESRSKEVVLITLPYRGEQSAYKLDQIPVYYMDLEIAVLIEQEELNIIILEGSSIWMK